MRRSRLTAVLAATLFSGLVVVAPAQAAFPGGNGRIAYQDSSTDYNLSEGTSSIHTMETDGSGDSVISPPGVYDVSPKWSPDGTKIAFVSARPGGDNIWTMNADGSGRTQLTSAGSNFTPTWSPDGTKIAFRSNRDGNYEIYRMNADGSNVIRLTTRPEVDFQPAWSPDGTKIAFESGRDIWTVDPNGNGLTRLTSDGRFGVGLDWSPDGSTLVTIHNSYVTTVSADGSNIHEITGFGRGADTPDYYAAYFHYPIWSPDGRKVVWASSPGCTVFSTCSSDYPRLHVGDVDSEREERILRYYADEASWQPIPNRPPDCSGVTASPSVLRTHNRRFVPVMLGGATDPDGDPVTLSVDGVTQDEPVTGPGDRTSPDAISGSGDEVRLRAERNPHGDGRVYRIAFTASDGKGGSCSGTATVSVPRKSKKPAVDSAPPSYDSFAR